MTAEDRPQDRTIRGAVVGELLAERHRLRRWLAAVSSGRATKETHAEIRDYLNAIGW